ncbi:ParB/RepB/Spo0J family partition protein [Sulfobacillus harzensis]|uniref:ParB/RepB/Spo0J family partition protein n=1 Tax=Sulfobacillus harzensis TaxID=2729629 RepID=A0A7Y0L080_9FIRM|nr:ParB/RepB/Spo0J family partition protein [Sulfobacillus harzensis]NMP20924.1 ParB/RepB/Spo0J family partition protein [Sulfobacillus harzensis]
MAKARGLGRGLSSLIPERSPEERTQENLHGSTAPQGIDLGAVEANPFQPRRVFREEDLAELTASIRIHGVIQPILVRPVDGHYQLIAGERRVRAARAAGLRTIPAVVKEFSDREAVELALVENLQRSDLNPMEESLAYNRLIDEFGWTQEEIGARVGKSRSHVANYLRLLNLEEEIQRLISEQALTVAHAKVLLSVADGRRRELARRSAEEGWTVKQLEAAVKRGDLPPRPKAQEDVHLKSVEAGLRRRLGTKVTLRGDSQKGRIEIPYRSLDELERLLAILDHEPSPSDGGFVV